VEPGQQLIARACDQLNGVGDVQFVNARLEDASLPRAQYSAVFSASAIHWIDPTVSWRKAADALVDGGSLVLVSYFGLDDPRSADDQQALRAAMTTIAPELAADWPIYRDLAGTLAGVAARRDALIAENQSLHQRLGRPIRSSTVACLVVARRQPRT
jgi:hypothetical protein